jgi:hypothetical protein
MLPCSETVTSSRFERRAPPGRLDSIFEAAFGSDGAAARYFNVSKMTIWRWRHDKSDPPKWVLDVLTDLVQKKVGEVHQAQRELKDFIAELRFKRPRKLSGCCAGYQRNAKPW